MKNISSERENKPDTTNSKYETPIKRVAGLNLKKFQKKIMFSRRQLKVKECIQKVDESV
jgi:hypothetical protein